MAKPIIASKNIKERNKVSKMPTKHNAPFLLARYYELQELEGNETNRMIKALYRGEMRKLKNILLKKYKITLDE